MTIPDFVPDELGQLGLTLETTEFDRLACFLDLMLDENSRVNLTSIRNPEQAWRRHIIDSLTLYPGLADLPTGATVADVGSGGGLPGIVLAVTLDQLKFTLIEATGKKARFIEAAAKQMQLSNVQVLADRAETVGQQSPHRQRYDAVVCRAVGQMRELLEYTMPLVKVGGFVLAMKGPSVEKELDEAGDALEILGAGDVKIIDAYPQGCDINTVIVAVVKDRPTPQDYPRRPGLPRHEPL
jgi:16S rRNA (guanine527-N7)-methyltransferase